MRKLKAPGYRVLVRLKPIEKDIEVLSDGGVIVQINSQKDLQLQQEGITEGWVLDIGPMAFRESENVWFKKGDKVVIYKNSGALMPDLEDGHVYRMIQDLDVQGVFEEEGIEL
jgi:co-chaperonin GroES (HSP10)